MKDEKYTLLFDMNEKGHGYEITGSEMNAVVVLLQSAISQLSSETVTYSVRNG